MDVLKGDDRGASGFVPGATLKGYERLDLHAFYNGFKPFRIALQVRNVFDERYVEGTDLRREWGIDTYQVIRSFQPANKPPACLASQTSRLI